MDHPKEEDNEREFKRLIIGEILDQLEKSQTREASYKWSTFKYNSMKAYLPKTFSEIIVASKCGALARIEKQVVS